MRHTVKDGRVVVGWREWVALPKLGLPAIKAKVDTGALTSALHAFAVEPFEQDGVSRVRFGIHPLQGRTDIEVFCTADVVDERMVSDSGGHREKRMFIRTTVVVAGLELDAELSLTNRDTMKFRMLLGRTAMQDMLLIAPDASFLTGRKIARDYKKLLGIKGKR